MELNKSLKRFSEVFGRNNTDIGIIDHITEDKSNKNDLDSFYKILSFNQVLTIGGEMSLNIQPFYKLEKAQEGWGLILKNDILIIDDVNWKEYWIVFSNRNDNAIFFDKKHGNVLGTIDKKQFFELGESLSVFFEILTECMILERGSYNFETSNDDEETLPEFLDDVFEILIKKMTEEKANEFMEFFFG